MAAWGVESMMAREGEGIMDVKTAVQTAETTVDSDNNGSGGMGSLREQQVISASLHQENWFPGCSTQPNLGSSRPPVLFI